MKIEIRKDINQNVQQKAQVQTQKQPQVSEEQMRIFLRQYELKNLTLKEMYEIYYRNALTPHFENTLKSSMVLIFLPALTNLYYTFRPNSPLASIIPMAIPFLCFFQYYFMINKDFEKFCFTNSQDSKELRQKFKILYAYSLNDKIIDNIVEDIIDLENKQNKKDLI